MYKKELEELGLNEKEACVYTILLENKKLKASEVLSILEEKNEERIKKNKTGKKKDKEEIIDIPRVLMYKILDDLVDKKIVKKKNKNSTHVYYEADSPKVLVKNYKKKVEQMLLSEEKLEKVIDKLDEEFQVNSVKPGVIHIERVEDIQKIMDMTLKSKTEVYTIIDPTFDIKNEKLFKKSQKMASKRAKLGIKKKVIYTNNKGQEKEIKELIKKLSNDVTEIKISKKINTSLKKSVIHIFDGKVIFINNDIFDDKGNYIPSAMVIVDKDFYKMQKFMFEENWENLK